MSQPATPARGRAPSRSGPGFLLTLDGPSGVGKTTVAALVADHFRGRGPVLLTGQPSRSPIGQLARTGTHQFRGLVLTFLMAADRHHHLENVIAPALAADHVVVCDRYVLTALVLDQLDGARPGFIWNLYRRMPRPDLAVVLTGDPVTCRARAAARGTYSRFHEGGELAARTETAMFERAAAYGAARGYPAEVLDIEILDAAAVAARVAARVSALREGTASR